MDKFPWTTQLEELMAAWGDRCKSYRWMHYKSALYYGWWHKAIGIPTGVITAASSATIFSETENDKTEKIVVGSILMLSSMLSFLQYFLGYGELAEKHKTMAGRYSNLANKIEIQMRISRKNREDAGQSIQFVLGEFENLNNSLLTIPHYIMNKFTDSFKFSELTKPEIANTIVPIKIHSESTSSDDSMKRSVSCPSLVEQEVHKPDHTVVQMDAPRIMSGVMTENKLLQDPEGLQKEFELALEEKKKKAKDSAVKYQLSRLNSKHF